MSDNLKETVEPADYKPVAASWDNPTAELRFVERSISVPLPQGYGYAEVRKVKILQQRWDIGLPAVTRSEWRDVPLVTEE